MFHKRLDFYLLMLEGLFEQAFFLWAGPQKYYRLAEAREPRSGQAIKPPLLNCVDNRLRFPDIIAMKHNRN